MDQYKNIVNQGGNLLMDDKDIYIYNFNYIHNIHMTCILYNIIYVYVLYIYIYYFHKRKFSLPTSDWR